MSDIEKIVNLYGKKKKKKLKRKLWKPLQECKMCRVRISPDSVDYRHVKVSYLYVLRETKVLLVQQDYW